MNCRALVVLGFNRSCPNCGLVDALRPLPSDLSAIRPNLEASVVYGATRIVAPFVIPALAFYFAYNAWSSYDNLPIYAYPATFLVGFLVGLLAGPAIGALIAYLPWLTAQCINRAAISPYRAFRWRRRVEHTFQGSFEKLARRRSELSEQMTQMYRTLGKVREALAARSSSAISSKRRLAGAEQALRAGIQARRDALESVDAVSYLVECQLLECEIAALRLLPCEAADIARLRLAQLHQIEVRLRAVSGNAVTECLEEKRRVEAEIEAVAEVDALCDLELFAERAHRSAAGDPP